MASIYRLGTKWRAQVRLKGKPSQSEVFDTRQEAVVWARRLEGAMHKTSPSEGAVLYSELQSKYLSHLTRCGYTKQQVLAKLNEYWKDWRLGDITSQSISDYALKRQRDGLAPSTVLTELIYMGVALQHGGILTGNQEALRVKVSIAGAIKTLRNIGAVGDAKQRKRRPSEEELKKLEEFFFYRPRSQTPMWGIIQFAIATAMRLGEICGPGGVVWEDLDEVGRLITIRARKDPVDPLGYDEVIPLLSATAVGGKTLDPVAIILAQKTARRRQGRIFPFSENTVSQAFTIACRQLGIEDLHFHDLRHDAISRLFEAGYSIPEVAKVSGHKSWKNLQRYTQISPEHLHDKAAKLESTSGNI